MPKSTTPPPSGHSILDRIAGLDPTHLYALHLAQQHLQNAQRQSEVQNWTMGTSYESQRRALPNDTPIYTLPNGHTVPLMKGPGGPGQLNNATYTAQPPHPTLPPAHPLAPMQPLQKLPMMSLPMMPKAKPMVQIKKV